MAMTVSEMIAFEREGIESSLKLVSQARIEKRYSLATLNFNLAMQGSLMLAMLQWRHGLGNPHQALTQSLDFAFRAFPELSEIDSTQQHWTSVDFGPPGYVCCILRGSIDSRLLEWHCQFNDLEKLAWKHGGIYLEKFLDAGIFHARMHGAAPEGWSDLLAKVAAKKRLALVNESYVTYMEIVLSARQGDSTSAAAAVLRAAANYNKRARNAYYSGGIGFEGGGPNNEHVVDYRLAALIRMCLPDQGASLTGDAAIHVWRW